MSSHSLHSLEPHPSSHPKKLTDTNVGNVLNLINNVYYCGSCSVHAETDDVFETHVLGHKFEGLYQCLHCPALGPDTNSIDEHMAQKHPMEDKHYGYLAFPQPSEVVRALKGLIKRPEISKTSDTPKSKSPEASSCIALSNDNESSKAVSEKQQSTPSNVTSNSKTLSLKPSELSDYITNIITASLSDTQESAKGKMVEQTPSSSETTPSTSKEKETERGATQKTIVKPINYRTIEVSDDDDSDIEITGVSHIPTPKPTAPKTPESTKPNNSYETKLQCAYTNGQYVCKSCKLGSKYLSQFALHVYGHLHEIKDGVHGCPYCPQDVAMGVSPINCKLVVQLLGILEKQKTAQELCKHGFSGNSGTFNTVEMGAHSASITKAGTAGSVQPSVTNTPTPVRGPSEVSSSEKTPQEVSKQGLSGSTGTTAEVGDNSASIPKSTDNGNVQSALINIPFPVRKVTAPSLTKPDRITAETAPTVLDSTPQVTAAETKDSVVNISPIVIAPIVIEPEGPADQATTPNTIPTILPSSLAGVSEPDQEAIIVNEEGSDSRESQNISPSPSTSTDHVPVERTLIRNDGPAKPALKVDDQKPGGRSIVRCYHEDDQFVCERCKYSIHHSKPKVFRKHLWFEVHPTRDCNHCPESNQYNRFKSCPIINQLMLYLLDAKAKKEKKLAEEAQKENSEAQPSEQPVEGPISGPSVDTVEPNCSLEQGETQRKEDIVDDDRQTNIHSDQRSSEGLTPSSTGLQSSNLPQTTDTPIEIRPSTPTNISANVDADVDKQLESSTADVIKMIQGLNSDLEPGDNDQGTTSVGDTEPVISQVASEASGGAEGQVNGQVSQEASSLSSTAGSKGLVGSESNTEVISLSSEDEVKDGSPKETPAVGNESSGQDLGFTSVEAEHGSVDTETRLDEFEVPQTLCITSVVSQAGAETETNEGDSLTTNIQETHATSITDTDVGNKISKQDSGDEVLTMEVSNPPDKTPDLLNELDEDTPTLCITNVVSETVLEDDATVEQGTESLMVSSDRAGMESSVKKPKPGDTAEEDVGLAGQKVNADVDIQTAKKEPIEIPNSSKRSLSRPKRGLSLEKDGEDNATAKKVAKTSNTETLSKVDKTPSSNSSKKVPTGHAYVCSFFKCSLWVAQDAGSFKIHNLLHHPNVKNLPCAFCSETFAKVEALITHTDRTHTESQLIIMFKSYNCGFKDCWLACERAVDFLNHNQSVHPSAKSFPCAYCKQAFRTLAELVLHIDESVTYSCTVCPNVLKSTYTDIRKHVLNSAHGSKRFLATGEVDSEIKLNLTCVLSNETGEIKYKSINRFVHVEKPVQEGSSKETFKCTKCSVILNDERSFAAHISECAKKGHPKDSITLLRSARPAVIKKYKGSETKSSEIPGPSSNVKDKNGSNKTSSGNSDIQHTDSEKVSGRNLTETSKTNTSKSRKDNSNWAQVNEGSDDSEEIEVIGSYHDQEEQNNQNKHKKDNDNMPSQSHSVIDEKNSSPVDNSGDDDDNYLPDIEESPSSPEVPPTPVEKRGVLQSLGKGQSVSCEKCSFATEFRVVKAIHERVHLHDQDQSKLLWCPHCPYSTSELLHFKIHVQCHTEKTKIRLYNCGHCSLSSNKMDLIDDHHEEVHADLELKSEVTRLSLEDLQCTECTTILKTEIELLEHLEQQHTGNSIQRYLKDMYNIASLKIVNDDAQHQQAKARVKSVTPATAASVNPKISEYAQLDIDRFKCPCCEYSCHKYQTWARHIVRNHKSLAREYIVFSCGMCKWKSTDKAKLIGHCEMKHNEITVVEQKLKLAEINVEVEAEDDGKLKDTKEDTSYLHHCDFCSFSTYQKADLVAHWQTHEGQTLSSTLSSDDEDTGDTIIVGETDEGKHSANTDESGYSNYSKDIMTLIEDTILNLKYQRSTLRKIARCPICPFTSKFRNYMLKHLNFHKKTAGIREGFQCGYCLYISEFESVLTKHMKKEHASRPMKKKVIGNARLRFINEFATGEELPDACGELASLKEQMPDEDIKENIVSTPDRKEDSGGSSPANMEDEQISSTAVSDVAENRFAASSTDLEDMAVNAKLRFRTRNVKQEYDEKPDKENEERASSFSTMEEYFSQDGQKLEYTEETLRLLDDIISNILQSERGHYKGTMTCPICPLVSPDKCSLRLHLQSHKSQALITDGYRCGYCLYTSEKLYPITRHVNQFHPSLPKKTIRIGIPDNKRASTKKPPVGQVTEFNSKDDLGVGSVDDNNDSPGFMISAAVGSDGSTAMVNIDAEQASAGKKQGEDSNLPMGVSQEMEEYCRSLYCTEDVSTSLFQCKKCAFLDDDPGRVYSHFCTRHREDCPFQCGYCEYRSVAVVKIGQHCEISHNGLPVKVSPVIAGSNSENPRDTNSPDNNDHGHDIMGHSDGLSTYMIDCGDDVHMCSICGYEHSGRQGLKNHLLVSHLNDYPYKCSHCEFAATESNQVQKHTMKCHPNLDQTVVHRNSMRPSIQGSEGNYGLAVKQEPRSPQPGTSSGEFFIKDNHSDSHDKKKRQAQNYNYEHNKRCELCSYSTKWNVHDLKVHVVTTHLHIQPYTCRFCVFGSRLRSIIVAHYRTKHNRMHEDIEEHWENLQKALRVWEEDGFTYCGISDQADIVKLTYKPNIHRSHKSKYITQVKKAEPSRQSRPAPYPSRNEFPASGMLKKMSTTWQEGPNDQPASVRDPQALDLTVKAIQGSVAPNFNPEQNSGIQHISLTATEPSTGASGTQISGTVSLSSASYVLHGCKACDKKFSLRHMAQYHIMVEHLRMNPFMCSRCTFGAKTRNEVIDHSFNVHINEEVTVLPAYMEHLDVQEYLMSSTVGSQEYEHIVGNERDQPSKPSKQMSCSVCHERFPNTGALDEHMVTEHLDYSGFRCTYCGTYIKAKMQMRTHFLNKHPHQDIKYKAVKEGMVCGKTLYSFPTATWLKNKAKSGGFASVNKGLFTSGLSYSARGRMGGLARAKMAALQKAPTAAASPHHMNVKTLKEFNIRKIKQYCLKSGGTMQTYCKHCSYTSPNTDLIREHCYRHLNYKPFKCGYCDYESLLRKVIVRHQQSAHTDQPESINKVIDTALVDSIQAHFSIKLVREDSSVTLWNGSDVSGLGRPLKTQVAEEQREKESMPPMIETSVPEPSQGEMFICVLCGEERDNRSNLLQHIMWELNYRPWSCPHCEFRDVTLLNIKKHCFNAHPALPFKVVIQKDQERMAKIQALVERSRVSVDEVIQDNPQKNTVDDGRIPPPQYDSPMPTAPEQPEEGKFKPFKCSYCDTTAYNLSELSEHVAQEHPDMQPLNVFRLDEDHQPPEQEPSYTSASQAAASSNRVSLEPSVDPQAEGGILAQLEADLNRAFTDPNQERAGKSPRPRSGSKKTLSGSQGRSPKPNPEYPDGYIGNYVGVTVTTEGLELMRDGSYNCRKCPYASTKNNAVGHYVRMHTPPRWKCAYCDFKDQVACYVRRHISKRHPGQPEDVIFVGTEDADGQSEALASREVNMDSGSDISEHVEYAPSTSQAKAAHSSLQESPVNEPLEKPDGYIGQFDGIVVTDEHLKVGQDGAYYCQKCSYMSTMINAVGHYVRCHTAERWKCPYCEFRCRIKPHIRRHIRKKHPGRPIDMVALETGDTRDTSEQSEGGVLSQLEAELDSYSDVSGDVDSELGYSSLLKKTLSNLQDSPASGSPVRPDGYIGHFVGVSVTTADLRLEGEGVYSCRKCSFSSTQDSAVAHYVRKHTEARWKCPYCNFKNTVTAEVRRHIKNKHRGRPIDVVPVETPDAEEEPGLGVLAELEAELDNSSDMSEDVEYDPMYMTKSNNEPQEEALGVIGKFDGVAVTDKHLLEDSNGHYSCRICMNDFGATKVSAVNHYVRCHMPQRWKCPHCDLKFSITYEVRRHCRNSHPGLPVDIVLIDTDDIDAATAKPAGKRLATSSKPGPASSKKQKPNPTNLPSMFCCYLCNFKTDNTLKLIEHQRRHADTGSSPAKSRSPSPNHEEPEHKRSGINCPHCFYVAKSGEDLKVHNREKHVFLRPFKCGYCDFSAFSKGKVRVHLQSNHDDEPEWILDQKEFADFETMDAASRARRSTSTSRSTPATGGVRLGQEESAVVTTDNVSALPNQQLDNLLKENNVRSVRW